MLTREEIFQKVAGVIMEALNVDEEEVREESTLQGDLGAESVDFLDIVFRLQREFRVEIPRGELFPESLFQGDLEYVHNGLVTKKGISLMEKQMPWANFAKFKQDPRLEYLSDLFTVGLLVSYIENKLNNV